jgi:outer membrane receptor protein involved in Fe transport
MQDGIAFLPDAGQPSDWRVAQNGATVSLWVLEDRLEWNGRLGPLRFRLDGSVTWSGGDRTGFYRAVPEVRAVTGARVGSELFKGSSALYLNVAWQYTSPRQDYDGNELSRYDVLNVIISGRLVDAHLYAGVYNVTDEQYETNGAYLMMPRTLVYGIAWTLFD